MWLVRMNQDVVKQFRRVFSFMVRHGRSVVRAPRRWIYFNTLLFTARPRIYALDLEGLAAIVAEMKPHHFPSTSALRYLAWLTRPSSTTPTILPLRHHRPFSLSAQCPVERSSSARSPRARKAARQTGSSFAAANHKNRDSLRAFEDVLLSKWVMRDFEELGLKPYTNWSNSPQVFVLDTFLGTMKNGNSPAGVARWFTGQHTNDEGKSG